MAKPLRTTARPRICPRCKREFVKSEKIDSSGVKWDVYRCRRCGHEVARLSK